MRDPQPLVHVHLASLQWLCIAVLLLAVIIWLAAPKNGNDR